jgi:predicted RNase H-like HicB family nuclease
MMTLTVETELESDGRWIAEIPQIPGVLAYGSTQQEAVSRAEALALRILAERLEHGERSPEIEHFFSVIAG